MAAAMCSALSDVGRLRLVLRLMNSPDGELCVSELVEHEQAKASSISARLQVLHAARLLTRRREMKHIYYSLADNHVRHLVLNILGHAAEPVSSTPQPLVTIDTVISKISPLSFFVHCPQTPDSILQDFIDTNLLT